MKAKVGFALYNDNWKYVTGTETIALELSRRLVELDQFEIEYKLLLGPDIDSSGIGLSKKHCINAPRPGYSLPSRFGRKAGYFFYRGVDLIRENFKAEPLLGYLIQPWIKKWLRSLDLDLLYLPSMWYHAMGCGIPIVAQLYDMQHIHFPEFWQDEYFQRKIVLGWYARNAVKVTCNFDFVAKDIKSHLFVPENKIAAVFLAPPAIKVESAADQEELCKKYNIPPRYIVYPAAAWPHKNHINLIRAVSKCVRMGIDLHCICPGQNSEGFYPGQFSRIKNEIRRYSLEKNFLFPGCLPSSDVYSLIRGADFVCVPSFYEAGCYPIWEAFYFSKAVACSDVTMIAYQVQDAAVLFDPYDPDDIANAIRLLWENGELRSQLGRKAGELVRGDFYDAKKTALGYHRVFVNSLVERGVLSDACRICDDPAVALDKADSPARFAWREILR